MTTALSSDAVLAIIADALCTVLEIAPSTVTRQLSFAQLNADSLALVEIVEILEEQLGRHQLGFVIDDQDLDDLLTVDDLLTYALDRL